MQETRFYHPKVYLRLPRVGSRREKRVWKLRWTCQVDKENQHILVRKRKQTQILSFFPVIFWHFSMPYTIPMYSLYILTACISFQFFFVFGKQFVVVTFFRWLIFYCDLLSLYPSVHFLSIWLSGIIYSTHSSGESASPWNVSLWIFASS